MSEPTEREPMSDERTLRDQLVAAGTEAAEQWLSKRAHRRMSEVNRKRLAGHVVSALWQQIEQATVEIAQWLAEDDRAELGRTRSELSARLAAESADAAAGSYAGRACVWPACLTEAQQLELAENVHRLMLGEDTGPGPEPDCDCTERFRAGLPRITDGITGDEAYASATLDLTFEEIRRRVAGYNAATARAERAEVALAELQAEMADPFNPRHIAQAVKRANRQRDEAVEAAEAERDEYAAELRKRLAGDDKDVLAVAKACAGVMDGTPPQSIRHEYAIQRLRVRFADRIADAERRGVLGTACTDLERAAEEQGVQPARSIDEPTGFEE